MILESCMHYFLRLKIQYHADDLFVSQKKYAQDLIHKFGMDDCSIYVTPCKSGLKLLKDIGINLQSHEITQFRNMVAIPHFHKTRYYICC